MFYGEPQTLIVVSKDEIITNLLRKLIETSDDLSSENIIGTRDNSVRIVSWNEKVWLEQKKAGNVGNKVLFIGNVKGVEKLTPIIDEYFNKYGIIYGWAGSQAALYVNPRELRTKEHYMCFMDEISIMPVPEIAKKNYYVDYSTENVDGKMKKVFSFVKNAVKDVKSQINSDVERQMLMYGIVKFYEEHLEKFLNF